ncbi:MAG TPA: FecR domain-containing protein [Pedobacter sp.]|nr:FecR domain-containing protein [Pedobacter sp.]
MMNKSYNTGVPEWEQILRALNNGEEISDDRYQKLSSDERLLISQLQENQKLAEAESHLDEIDLTSDWYSISARLAAIAKEERIKPLFPNWLRYAAVILLPLMVGGIYLLSIRNPKEERIMAINKENRGLKSPILILSDGSSIELGTKKGITNLSGPQVFVQEENAIVYKTGENAGAIPIFNTLIIPRGAEYKLMLGDGTEVWINADTKIKYQVNLDAAKTREVFLEKGEAFFKVAKNPKKPFIVHHGNMNVEVLGTSFNINSYSNTTRTTLIEGKVMVSTANGENKVELAPNQQANFNKLTGSIEKQDVDVFSFVAWKDGILAFENETMADLMEQIGRLYDYDIDFKDNSLKQLHYSGSTDKANDIKKILNIIQKTSNLTLTLKERIIIVEKSTKN